MRTTLCSRIPCAITISKQRAIVKSLIAKTLKGDARAANTLLSAIFRVLDPDGTLADLDQSLNTDESETFAVLQARLLGKANVPTKAEPGSDANGGVS